MPMGRFHRSECLDCIPSNHSRTLRRVYRQTRGTPVGLCDSEGMCKCIRPYVADRTCHHVASKYGNVSQATFLGTIYGIWFPLYLFFIFGALYLLMDKCTAPMPRSKLSRYNKKNPRRPPLCRCNNAISIISLILGGLCFRGISLFVDPLNMFHIIPSSIVDLTQQTGTSCWLMSALFTIECFVYSTQLALKLRGALKGFWKLRLAVVGGAVLLGLWGLTDLIFRFVEEFAGE